MEHVRDGETQRIRERTGFESKRVVRSKADLYVRERRAEDEEDVDQGPAGARRRGQLYMLAAAHHGPQFQTVV